MQLLSLVETNGSKLLEIEEHASSDLLMPASSDPSMPASSDPSMPASSDPSIPASSDPSMPASSDPSMPASSDPAMPASSDPSMPAISDPSMLGNCSESCIFLTNLPVPAESFINARHQDSNQSDPGCMLGPSDLHSEIRKFDVVESTVDVDETQNRTESVEAPCCELKQSTANDGSNIEGRNIGINFKPVENVRSRSLAVTVIGKLSNRDGKSQSQELLSQTRKRSLQDAIKLNRYLRRGSLPFGDKTARKVSDFALSFVGDRHYSIDLSRSKSFERLPNFSRRGSELISNQDYSYDVTEDEELFLKLRVRPLLNNLEFELAAAEACEDDCESLYMIKDLSPDEDGDEKISTARYIPGPQEISCLD